MGGVGEVGLAAVDGGTGERVVGEAARCDVGDEQAAAVTISTQQATTTAGRKESGRRHGTRRSGPVATVLTAVTCSRRHVITPTP